jgi:hypothetical protein
MLVQHLSRHMVEKVALRLPDIVIVDGVSNFAGEAVEMGLALCGVVFSSWGGHERKLVPVREVVRGHGSEVRAETGVRSGAVGGGLYRCECDVICGAEAIPNFPNDCSYFLVVSLGMNAQYRGARLVQSISNQILLCLGSDSELLHSREMTAIIVSGCIICTIYII